MAMSILQLDLGHCFYKGCPNLPSEIHYVFPEADRDQSDYGELWIHVCPSCAGKIRGDHRRDATLKRLAQLKWEDLYKARTITHQVTLGSLEEVNAYVE